MAKCEISFPDEFAFQLSELGKHTDEITARALEAAADKVIPVFKSNLAESIGNTTFPSRSTGELLASVGKSPAMVDKNGNTNVKIGFNEPRKTQYAAVGKRSYYEITNAMIANVIEYGKHSLNQPPRPFLKRTKSQTMDTCIEAAQQAFDEEVKKL